MTDAPYRTGPDEAAKRDPWYWQRWAHEQRVGHPVRKLLLTAIATRAESTTGQCFASQADLAFDAECGVRSVVRYLKVLEDDGFLQRQKRTNADGTRAPDGFQLLDQPAVSDATESSDAVAETPHANQPHAQLASGHLNAKTGGHHTPTIGIGTTTNDQGNSKTSLEIQESVSPRRTTTGERRRAAAARRAAMGLGWSIDVRADEQVRAGSETDTQDSEKEKAA